MRVKYILVAKKPRECPPLTMTVGRGFENIALSICALIDA